MQLLSRGAAGLSPYALGPFGVDLLPAPVTGLTVTGRDRSLAVTWTPSTSGDVQEVDVLVVPGSTAPDPDAYPDVTTTAGAAGATLTGLADGTTYTVAVVGRDGSWGASAAEVRTATTLQRSAHTSGPGPRHRCRQAARPAAAAARHGHVSSVAAVVTSSTGTVLYRRVPTVHTEYRWSLAASATDLAAVSAARAVRVAPKVTATLSTTRILLGRNVALSGLVTPNHRGQRVYLQQRIGTSWRNMSSQLLTSSSTVRFVITGRTRGTQYYRLYKPADADHHGAYSPVRAFSVV